MDRQHRRPRFGKRHRVAGVDKFVQREVFGADNPRLSSGIECDDQQPVALFGIPGESERFQPLAQGWVETCGKLARLILPPLANLECGNSASFTPHGRCSW
ncbi:MAG TPA: hypothetical protein VFX76_00440 [Roseiflexaceae bacterium]|nr:hypothetical protein [Roseiflexaceae bacterium]